MVPPFPHVTWYATNIQLEAINATSLRETFLFGMLIFSQLEIHQLEYCNELVGNVSRHPHIIQIVEAEAMKVIYLYMTHKNGIFKIFLFERSQRNSGMIILDTYYCIYGSLK